MANYTTGPASSNYRHGYASPGGKHPLYVIWQNMRTRCMNQKHEHWAAYGGRGITIDPRWLDPLCFIEDMLPTWKPGLEIDRIDNNGNYTKENCQWSTRKTQNRNTRASRIIETPSGPMCLAEAIEKYGKVPAATVRMRLHRGMDPWKAITSPLLGDGFAAGTIKYKVLPNGKRERIKDTP